MGRSGYCDDYGSNSPEEQWALICYRGAVKKGLRGARGQAFLREMIAALDAMETKALAQDSLRTPDGAVCALGAVGVQREMAIDALDPDNIEAVACAFGIATSMAREIVYMNDEGAWHSETPEMRWRRMRDWAKSWLTHAPAQATP